MADGPGTVPHAELALEPAQPITRWSAAQRQLLQAMGLAGWQAVLDVAELPVAGSAPRVRPSSSAGDSAPAPTRSRDEPRATTQPPVAIQPAPAAEPQPVSLRSQQPLGLGAMDWAQLADTARACRACRLCEARTQVVFGSGRTDAHWMVVGEAPGEHEDRQGLPFVGKSGQLLDAMLASLGLSRGDEVPRERAVYIANAVKCRPPGNRNPEPDELTQCEPFLIQQVALLKPRIILAMGRFAVQSLLRSHEAIGKLRGRAHDYRGVPLFVTYHPAYLLRNPLDKARAWDDLSRARHHLLQG